MGIADPSRTERYLRHINYYRLRAYWLPFELPAEGSEHRFKEGTTFDGILNHYIFDRKFRLLVLEAIERVEVSCRTQFAYVLALKHGSHAHLQEDLFREKRWHKQLLDSLREEIERSQETFIEHYRTKYSDPQFPPIWSTCEVMSFGQLSKWFKNLKFRQDRQQIAGIYRIDEKVLRSFMHHITHVRNLCAHHCRLWNRRLTFTMTLPKSPSHLGAMFNNDSEREIYNTLVMLSYLLRCISPGTSWPIRLKNIILEIPDLDTAAMGFPKQWRDSPPWNSSPLLP